MVSVIHGQRIIPKQNIRNVNRWACIVITDSVPMNFELVVYPLRRASSSNAARLRDRELSPHGLSRVRSLSYPRDLWRVSPERSSKTDYTLRLNLVNEVFCSLTPQARSILGENGAFETAMYPTHLVRSSLVS